MVLSCISRDNPASEEVGGTVHPARFPKGTSVEETSRPTAAGCWACHWRNASDDGSDEPGRTNLWVLGRYPTPISSASEEAAGRVALPSATQSERGPTTSERFARGCARSSRTRREEQLRTQGESPRAARISHDFRTNRPAFRQDFHHNSRGPRSTRFVGLCHGGTIGSSSRRPRKPKIGCIIRAP